MENQNIEMSSLAIVSEVELVYISKVSPSKRPLIRCSEDAYQLMKLCWNKRKLELVEEFKVIYMNHAGRVLAIKKHSEGGITSTVVDTRIILATALLLGSTSILLCHNHPSGNLEPSNADLVITQEIKQAAKLHKISLSDHIILTSETYTSFKDNGQL